jgi:hypothetical protein
MSTPMVIRANDENGDWLWGNGLSDILQGQPAVAQNVQTSLLCFQNDCFWNMTFGVDWFNLLGIFNPQAETGILLQCREIIINSWGVTAINAIDAVLNSSTRAISLLYNLSSVYSTQFAAQITPLAT